MKTDKYDILWRKERTIIVFYLLTSLYVFLKEIKSNWGNGIGLQILNYS
ncbi:hypothetical protein SAMN02927937_00330 [Paenimyroides aquimaris]|uniref:Uncharacterized protein n=1 Tax=Paenimyroides marinum TaxID=1159016 RepID=A0A1H6J9I7_9FLAO|nr:hypothetical protein SAMN02927937_00330 [Paenimyroides aquimaris]